MTLTLVDAPTKTKTKLQQSELLCPHCGADRRAVRKMLASQNTEEREEAARTIERCRSCTNALYEAYRRFIGKCESCGALMATHPKCEACGALCGLGHDNVLSPYRGHEICGPCLKAWKWREKDLGREITWSESLNTPTRTHTCSMSGKKPRARRLKTGCG